MPPELKVLALAGLLQVIQFVLMAIPVNIQMSPAWTASARDEQRLPQGVPGRLWRAMNNHFEGLILFTLAVVVVTLSDQSTALTAACAYTYLAARVLYVPAYVFGWVPWRSVIWLAGLVATTIMLLAALI